MAVKATSLVGLDVHARQTHAALLDVASGEVRVSRLQVVPEEVVAFLAGLPAPMLAVYEAGPTGFGLARAARERGIDVRVVAPGSIPKGSGDRVKTDRRDAIRMVRLLAAGELSFAFVPTVGDEQLRDMVRCIDDIRGDLMRSRHRLGKFLLRRGERFPGPGGAWTVTHMRWLRTLRFADACSCATFADYLAAVELLIGRRRTLLELLEQQSCECSHAPVIARLRCFRGINTLTAAGVCAEVGDFARATKALPVRPKQSRPGTLGSARHQPENKPQHPDGHRPDPHDSDSDNTLGRRKAIVESSATRPGDRMRLVA